MRSRKTPYWLSPDQRRVVRRLRARGVGPTWFCDASDAARPLLTRAGIPEEFIVDVKDHPLLPGEHATEQWRRLAQILPAAVAAPDAAVSKGHRGLGSGTTGRRVARTLSPRNAKSWDTASWDAESRDAASWDAELARVTPGCYLEVGDQQRTDLEAWLPGAGVYPRCR